jgi:hypothetical protein
MPARLEARLRDLEAQQSPDPLAGVGLASLLAYAAVHPPAPWELSALAALASQPTGLARCLVEARRRYGKPS